jgi:signal transduction histidine kinase
MGDPLGTPAGPPREALTDLLEKVRVAANARAAALEVLASPATYTAGFTDADPPLSELLASAPGLHQLTIPLMHRGEAVGTLMLFGAELREDTARTAEIFGASITACIVMQCSLDAAERRARFFETLIDHAPDAVMFFDRVESISYANRTAQRAFLQYRLAPPPLGAFPSQSIPYHRDGRQFSDDERPIARAMRGETVENLEAEVPVPDGSRVPVSCNAVPMYGEDGKLQGAVLTFRDITSQRELERLRGEFAAIIVHDLRDPISALVLTAENLLRHATADTVPVPVDVLKRIDHISRRLGVMVSELLDASRIELGRLALEPRALDLPAAVADLVGDIAPSLGHHAVQITVRARPAPVRVDPARFNQILGNLLENSAKYSRQDGPIAIAIDTTQGGATVAVTDEGPGIAPEDLPRLFDRFFQAQRARERRKEGLGLGLYIAKGLVEASGGHILARSRLGLGTTFEVWLPEAPPPPPH